MLRARWESLAGLVAADLPDCHPAEKAWKSFVISFPNQPTIKEFMKNENMVALGPISSSTTSFLVALKSFCGETLIERIRQWYARESEEKKGRSTDALVSAQADAKLALALATNAKAVYFKLPNAKSRDDKSSIAKKTKKHIDKAKLGKAHT